MILIINSKLSLLIDVEPLATPVSTSTITKRMLSLFSTSENLFDTLDKLRLQFDGGLFTAEEMQMSTPEIREIIQRLYSSALNELMTKKKSNEIRSYFDGKQVPAQ